MLSWIDWTRPFFTMSKQKTVLMLNQIVWNRTVDHLTVWEQMTDV